LHREKYLRGEREEREKEREERRGRGESSRCCVDGG